MFKTEGRTILVDDNCAGDSVRTVGGKLQRTLGGLTDDAPTQACGKADQSGSDAQSTWGQVVDEVRDFIADQPFVAVLSALGLGAVVGFLTTRR